MRVVVREAEPRDYAGYCALAEDLDRLHRDRHPEIYREPGGPVRDRPYFDGLLADPDVALFVAEPAASPCRAEGAEPGDFPLLGYVQVVLRESPPIPVMHPRRIAFIDSVVVAPHGRGSGAGRALMDRASGWAEERGARTIELAVYEFNQAAIGFYRGLGYATILRRMCKATGAPSRPDAPDPDALPGDDVREAYTRWAPSYDDDVNRTRDLDRDILPELLEGIRVGTLLEIGCGTGKNTPFLAALAGRVLAIDFSEGMLRVARERVRTANVRFALADLTRPWPVRAGSVDLIACNLVLEHVRDLGVIFSEAARVLAPGGRFRICELHPERQARGTQARGAGASPIAAFVHRIPDFLRAAELAGLVLCELREWRHEDDLPPSEPPRPPRLLTLGFEKRDASPPSPMI